MALVYQGKTPETIFSKRNQSFINVHAGSSQELLAEAKELGLDVVEKTTDAPKSVVVAESTLVVADEKQLGNGKK